MIIARRYASAIYEEAERQGKTAAVDRDIELIEKSFQGSRELVNFFKSPIIAREKKEEIVSELFTGRLHQMTQDFLMLLIEKQREDIFPDIVKAYRELRDRELGIVEAEARVAQPLGSKEEKSLTEALNRMTGKKVRLRVTEDPSLIGGVVIRVGDTVYDGSVRHHLEVLREQMDLGSYRMN